MTLDAQGAADSDLIEDVLARLRRSGTRVTSARRVLLSVLLASHGHRTAEELAADVQVRAPDVNLSTIYRNLDELERLKIVDRTHLGHGPAAYHLASAAHGHLVCERCGSMTEVPDTMFGDLAETTRQRYGFVMNPNRFAVIGLCADCQ
jgi:Fur family ferric uptake transcriptional regulator